MRKTCLILGLGLATSVVTVTLVRGVEASVACLMFACIANMAGVAAPAVTGFVVERTDHCFWAFVVCSGVVLVGAAAYAFLLGRVEPVQWPDRRRG
ncbi:MAG: MFS transporter [Verrucomicrobia bacterium]|nr:MAG: MFS transporter [Verrucomicrobiota bacterium]